MEQALGHVRAARLDRADALVDAADILLHTGRNLPEAAELLRTYLNSDAKVEQAPAFKAHYLLGSTVEKMGDKRVNDSVRLFFAPGMAHCGGGEGPNTFDALTPLEQWREQGKAPTEIIASHLTNGKVDRTRPLCPYPQVATYKGAGSIDQAENFVCAPLRH